MLGICWDPAEVLVKSFLWLKGRGQLAAILLYRNEKIVLNNFSNQSLFGPKVVVSSTVNNAAWYWGALFLDCDKAK